MNYGKLNTPLNLSNNCLLTISLNHTLGHSVHQNGHRYTKLKLLLATLTLLKHNNINNRSEMGEKIKNDTKRKFLRQCLFLGSCLFIYLTRLYFYLKHRLKDNIVVHDNILHKTKICPSYKYNLCFLIKCIHTRITFRFKLFKMYISSI